MPGSPAPLLQGTLELIVLQLLRAEPTNGYDLTLRIQTVSKDVLQVNAGSLYPALYRLEERGLITAEWQETAKGRRAKVYSLTGTGRKQLAEQRENWARFSDALGAILKTTLPNPGESSPLDGPPVARHRRSPRARP
jgi:transcriptional regulator